jgi:hypothetical protein
MSLAASTATAEVVSIALVLVVHFMGAGALIWLLVRDSGESARDWWPSDDDGGGPPLLGPRDSAPGGGGGALPLPSSDQSGVRLRDGERLADGYPRPGRRPAHAPERTPAKR